VPASEPLRRLLLIGNSRWHWGECVGPRLLRHWDGVAVAAPPLPDGWAAVGALPPVVAGEPWRQRQLTHRHVPLGDLPDHVGIDRALAAWAAWTRSAGPVLVVDAGTALTLTLVAGDGRFVGGRILAGVQLQLQALHRGTRLLPQVPVGAAAGMADPWPRATAAAMGTGVVEGLAAAVADAWAERPGTPGESGGWSLWLTGGDGPCLEPLLRRRGLAVRLDPALALGAMAQLSPARDP
jgi:type III pantothenate kinase